MDNVMFGRLLSRMRGHRLHRCRSEDCRICEGGLAYCNRCHCGEGTLLTFCPGYYVNGDDQDAIMKGKIVDLYDWKKMRDAKRAREIEL